MIFKNRVDAGRQLAKLLIPLKDEKPVVLGLPRGGVPVAFEVAKVLNAPLDVLIIRKLGVPWQPELAFGAIGEGGERYLNPDVLENIHITKEEIEEVESKEFVEIKKRQLHFHGNRKPIDISHKLVIIVDDGIATGATVQVACQVAKTRGAKEVVIATPVASSEAVIRLNLIADKCLVLDIPESFNAVGEWYEDFSQTTDDEVVRILQESRGLGGN